MGCRVYGVGFACRVEGLRFRGSGSWLGLGV